MDPVSDEKLADFVVSSHMRAHPEAAPEVQCCSLTLDDDSVVGRQCQDRAGHLNEKG